MTTFEAIQSRSSSSNGFSVMSASEVENRDMRRLTIKPFYKISKNSFSMVIGM